MNFEPTEAQREVQRRAREVASELIAPQAAELDVTERFPVETFRELGRRGMLGLSAPAAYGGQDIGTVSLALALEEIAYACASTAVGMSVTNMVADTIARFGDDALASRYVPFITSGESVTGAFCLSEPGSGSDAASMRTTAQRDGERYILNGTKMWITSGSYSGAFIVMARTAGPEAGYKGISAFVLEPGFDGFSTGRAEEKCGLRGSNTVPVIMEDCVVPASNLIGQEGIGFRIAMTALDGGRVTIGAMANGIARAALDVAARYASERPALRRSQAVQSTLADMASGLDAAQLLVWRAASLKEASAKTGARFTREAAIAKLHATENVKKVTASAVELLGVDGCTADYPVERLMRDARVTSIFEGTSEIQKLVIAREVYARA
jgi:alkylation response protein AidB-like acyl-CoA dehydrogenase